MRILKQIQLREKASEESAGWDADKSHGESSSLGDERIMAGAAGLEPATLGFGVVNGTFWLVLSSTPICRNTGLNGP